MRFALGILAIIGLILLLKTQFPYAIATEAQKMQLLFSSLLLLLIATGSGMLKRMTATQVARDAMIWVAIILCLVLGYSFRGDLSHSRLFGALVPSRIQQTADGGLSVQAGADGHFHMEAAINGTVINFLVDTGASDIVLSQQDAEAAGYELETLNYSREYSTANGIVHGAPVRIGQLDVGPYTLKDVPASINSGPMDTSLLGMAFLKQFRQYHVSDDILTLYP